MRSFWLGAVCAAASLAVTLVMLAVNSAFEAAGSVPDVEACGFLAGNLAGLLAIYPAATALVGSRAAQYAAKHRMASHSDIVRCLTLAGWIGGLVYFGAGLALIARRLTELPLFIWPIFGMMVALCGFGARIGAIIALTSRRLRVES